MQVMIDIPKYVYDTCKDLSLVADADVEKVGKAIANGTPLPKGHGRLIDADDAIKTLKSLGNRDYRREKGTIQEAEKMLSFDEYTPTIIEAESEGKDEER